MTGNEMELCEKTYRVAHENAEQVVWLTRAVYALVVVVVLQTLVKIVEAARVNLVLRRTNQLLTMTEAHGGMTDAKTAEIKKTVGAVGAAMVKNVQKAAEEIKAVVKSEPGGSNDGKSANENDKLPTVPPLPE